MRTDQRKRERDAMTIDNELKTARFKWQEMIWREYRARLGAFN